MIELEREEMISGIRYAVTIRYEHDGYRANHYVGGVEVNTQDATRCYATCCPVPTPEEGAKMALREAWACLIDDVRGQEPIS